MNLIILQVERNDAEKEKRHNELKSELAWLNELTPIEVMHLGRHPRMQYLMRELSRTSTNEQRP